MARDKNIILKMPKRVSFYYFLGLAFALILALILYFFPYPGDYASELRAIGLSIIAGAIVAIFAFAGTLVSRSAEEDEALLKTIKAIGIVDYFNRRYLNEEYSQQMKDAHYFDLIGYGLGTFRNENKDTFSEWAESKEMRILVINPASTISLQRDREEKEYIGKISRESRDITRDIIEVMYEQKCRRPIIKWYNAIPSLNIMRIGSVMYIGPYFVHKKSGASITIKLEDNGALFKLFEEQFNKIWINSNLSIDPSFVSDYPELLDLNKRYDQHKIYFVIGGRRAGKTTSLNVAHDLGYTVVDWSDVLKHYFQTQGIEYNIDEIRDKIKREGIHFFPCEIMRYLLRQFIDNNGKTKGFVVAGARNIKELSYLSSFFNPEKTFVLIISASHQTRYSRYIQQYKDIGFHQFIADDDINILGNFQSSENVLIPNRSVKTIINDKTEKDEFLHSIRDYFGTDEGPVQ